MVSAIVLVPDTSGQRGQTSREIVARSLFWLVPAVIAGVIRQVVLAAPPALDLDDLAEDSGCRLVRGAPEAERLAAAVDGARDARLLIIRTGFQPEGDLVEELGVHLRRPGPIGPARVLAAPETFLQRLFPDRTATVAVLATRPLRCLANDGQANESGRAADFDRVARCYRRAPRLRSCARRII